MNGVRKILSRAAAMLVLFTAMGMLAVVPAHAQIVVGGKGGDTVDSTTYSDTVSLTQIGTNAVDLSVNNTYSGGTVILSALSSMTACFPDADRGVEFDGINVGGSLAVSGPTPMRHRCEDSATRLRVIPRFPPGGLITDARGRPGSRSRGP